MPPPVRDDAFGRGVRAVHRAVRRSCAALLAALLLCVAAPAHADAGDAGGRYTPAPAGADGIGKRYMGRDIAAVMGWQGAAWLEREEREREERTDLLLAALRLRPGMTVADIGAGTGYLARRMAPAVAPGGRVLAVDVQPEMVALLQAAVRQGGLAQIEPSLGAEDDVRLPPACVDLAVMVDVYHELAFPHEVLASIVRALKPGGRLAFVEYRAEDPRRADQGAAQDERGADPARGGRARAGVGAHRGHAAVAAPRRVPQARLSAGVRGPASMRSLPGRLPVSERALDGECVRPCDGVRHVRPVCRHRQDGGTVAGVPHGLETVLVEALVAQPAVEAPDAAVPHGLARLVEQVPDAASETPRSSRRSPRGSSSLGRRTPDPGGMRVMGPVDPVSHRSRRSGPHIEADTGSGPSATSHRPKPRQTVGAASRANWLR